MGIQSEGAFAYHILKCVKAFLDVEKRKKTVYWLNGEVQLKRLECITSLEELKKIIRSEVHGEPLLRGYPKEVIIGHPASNIHELEESIDSINLNETHYRKKSCDLYELILGALANRKDPDSMIAFQWVNKVAMEAKEHPYSPAADHPQPTPAPAVDQEAKKDTPIIEAVKSWKPGKTRPKIFFTEIDKIKKRLGVGTDQAINSFCSKHGFSGQEKAFEKSYECHCKKLVKKRKDRTTINPR